MRPTTIAENFDYCWKLNVDSGCHIWHGYTKRDGYGYLHDPSSGKVIGAHVFAFKRAAGPTISISEKIHICHHCDNKLCVNPAHLFAGTNADNRRDSVRKGRHARGSKHGMAKLSPQQVKIVGELSWLGIPQKAIGARLGIGQSQVSRIVNGLRWANQ